MRAADIERKYSLVCINIYPVNPRPGIINDFSNHLPVNIRKVVSIYHYNGPKCAGPEAVHCDKRDFTIRSCFTGPDLEPLFKLFNDAGGGADMAGSSRAH